MRLNDLGALQASLEENRAKKGPLSDLCALGVENFRMIVGGILEIPPEEWVRKFQARRTLAGFDAFVLAHLRVPGTLGPRVVAHFYPDADDTLGHRAADDPHNHYGDFASMTEAGVITHTFYEVGGEGMSYHEGTFRREGDGFALDNDRLVQLKVSGTQSVVVGEGIFLPMDRIHSVETTPGTVTIVAEDTVARSYGQLYRNGPIDIAGENKLIAENMAIFPRELARMRARLERIHAEL